jgi:hypothetical protein
MDKEPELEEYKTQEFLDGIKQYKNELTCLLLDPPVLLPEAPILTDWEV